MKLACGPCRLSSTQARANPSFALLQGVGATDADGDRFDYNKDPISWFYQVQSSLTGVKGSRQPQQRGRLDTSCAHAAPPSPCRTRSSQRSSSRPRKPSCARQQWSAWRVCLRRRARWVAAASDACCAMPAHLELLATHSVRTLGAADTAGQPRVHMTACPLAA